MSGTEMVQLQRRLAEVERMQKQLLAPKSKARIITGGGDGEAGRFVLTTTPTGGATGATGAYMTATADIYKVATDGSVSLLFADVTLYLDYEMFLDLVSGDYGAAVKDARGKWVAVNAPCTTSPMS